MKDDYKYLGYCNNSFLNICCQASGGKYDVSKIMDTWTLQMGFPVVNVSSTAGGFELKQSRFYADRNPVYSKSKFNSSFE